MSISRKDLQHAKRVLVKVGSSVVVHSDGTVALGRLGNLVDQLTALLVRVFLFLYQGPHAPPESCIWWLSPDLPGKKNPLEVCVS